MYYIHRVLGYTLVAGIFLGGLIWWIALYRACANSDDKVDNFSNACLAFFPEGKYTDIRGPPYFCEPETIENRADETKFQQIFPFDECPFEEDGNPGAVLFLREVIVTALIVLLLSAGLKYPFFKKSAKVEKRSMKGLGLIELGHSIMDQLRFLVNRNSYELFFYFHLLLTYSIAIGAFFSRLEVFFIAVLTWGAYFMDKLILYSFFTHDCECRPDDKGSNYGDAMTLRLHKAKHSANLFATCAGTWQPHAGQIVYIQCPSLGVFWLGRQWHPFSLSTVKDRGDVIELLIKVHEGGWTEHLRKGLFEGYEVRRQRLQQVMERSEWSSR